MSVGQWVRQRIGWSNSRQAWEERAGFLLLLIGAAAIWWLGGRLSLLQHAVLWSLLLLTAAILLRRGWLKLFGPVLFYDMIRSARRGKYFLLRVVYAGLLLFFLFSAFADTWRRAVTHDHAARLAEQFFEVLMIVQLIAVTVLTPAYVAGAIAEEKERRTMEFILATDLRNREIVLSKLVARLANLSLFLLTGLPILSLVQFLGGVDPNLVLCGFLATLMTMFGLGGISILNSVMFKRPRDAIAMTYLMVVAYIGLSFALFASRMARWVVLDVPIWFGESPPTLGHVVDAITSGNLFLTIGHFAEALARGRNAVDAAWTLVRSYALFHGILAVACIVWATVRVRAVALRQAFGRTRRLSRAGRHRPPVGDNAMLWKELYIEGGLRFNLAAAILIAILIVATFLPAMIILIDYLESGGAWRGEIDRSMNAWVRSVGTLAGCLMLLGVAIRASSSIGAERDKQTYDALLTSPLDSNSILFAKWLGSILSIRLAWAWVGLIWLLGLVTGGLHFLAVPLLVVAWLVYAGFAAMLGLWFSMSSPTTLRATLWTMTWAVILGGGHMLIWVCCGALMFRGPGSARVAETLAQFQASLTPLGGLAVLAFTPSDFRYDYSRDTFQQWISFALVGIVLWTIAAAFFWFVILAPRYRVLTGRQDLRAPEDPRYRPRMRRPRRTEPPPLPREHRERIRKPREQTETDDWQYREDEDSG